MESCTARKKAGWKNLRPCLFLWLSVALALFSCGGAPRTWVEPNTSMEFVLIPAGTFVMGSPPDEPAREAQEVEHEVTLSKAFYMGRHEVTQRQWRRIMGSNPSWFPECGPECPVERVNYYDVEAFIARLEEITGDSYRLPTEAEWEYACRAGTKTPFSVGDNLTTDQANYDGRYPYPGHKEGAYRASPTPVGSYPPNRWGLYDMSGNVWEWTSDWHCPYPPGSAVDPIAPCESEFKVIRGGSWYFGADSARCALRYTHQPRDLGFSLGFRLVREE